MNVLSFDTVTTLHERGWAALEPELRANAFTVFALDGALVHDQMTFLAAVDRDLPTSPGLSAGNWDALLDVLSDGLARAEPDRVAIVWRRADRLELGDLQAFVTAVLTLEDVARRVYARAGTRDRRVLVILLGDAPHYPDFPA